MWQSPELLLERGAGSVQGTELGQQNFCAQAELAESKAGFRDRVSIIFELRNDYTCKTEKKQMGTGRTEGGGMGRCEGKGKKPSFWNYSANYTFKSQQHQKPKRNPCLLAPF